MPAKDEHRVPNRTVLEGGSRAHGTVKGTPHGSNAAFTTTTCVWKGENKPLSHVEFVAVAGSKTDPMTMVL